MAPLSALTPEARAWRARVFTATWLAYFGYYFCRKPFSIAKGSLMEAHGWDAQMMGNIGAVYLITYALGQFMSAWAGGRFGARAVLLTGMASTITVNAIFGITDSPWTLAAFMGLNGLFQATGWSANVGTIGSWFHRHERDRVMGIWATNFQAGSFFAGMFASYMLGWMGYQWSFFGGSLVLLGIWVFVLFNQRNRPEDVGLARIAERAEDDLPPGVAAVVDDGRIPRAVALNIGLIGIFYFFAKFIRYALWSWIPLLLATSFKMSGENAGYLSNVGDAAGFVGTIAAGLLAHRVFKGRLALLSFVFIAAMFASCLTLYLGGTADLTVFTVALGAVCFFLYGPDALMTGAAAVNVGSPKHAARAAGLISGIGSLGPIVQELVLPRFVGKGDIHGFLGIILTSALLSLAALGWILWRNRSGKAML